jgi:hypothetical protein
MKAMPTGDSCLKKLGEIPVPTNRSRIGDVAVYLSLNLLPINKQTAIPEIV